MDDQYVINNLMGASVDKARLGAIGENMVVAQLLQQGWDAICANLSIRNCKAIDVVCVHPDTRKTVLVQVKTIVGNSFPIGFTLEETMTSLMKPKVVGPWVFVQALGQKENMTFRYFIVPPSEFIKLSNDSNDWYINKWNRQKTISLKSPSALKLTWLEGKGEDEKDNHEAFVNPFPNGFENKWDNIWKD